MLRFTLAYFKSGGFILRLRPPRVPSGRESDRVRRAGLLTNAQPEYGYLKLDMV